MQFKKRAEIDNQVSFSRQKVEDTDIDFCFSRQAFLSKLPNMQLLDTEKRSYSRCSGVYTVVLDRKHGEC